MRAAERRWLSDDDEGAMISSQNRQRLRSAALLLAIFAAWEILSLLFNVSDLVLPRPSQIVAALIQRFPGLWPHALQTLNETLLGFVLGGAAGGALGVLVVVAALVLVAVLGIGLYGILALIERRVCGWAYRKNDFAIG